jgi:hypothetical protein
LWFACWIVLGNNINAEFTVNVTAYYFPKHGPPRPKIYAPKTHTNRFRNYKVKPEGKMIHTLKLPSIPLSFYASCVMEVRTNNGFSCHAPSERMISHPISHSATKPSQRASSSTGQPLSPTGAPPSLATRFPRTGQLGPTSVRRPPEPNAISATGEGS